MDALGAIEADLSRGLRRKRAHFMPALMLVGVVIVGALVVLNVRPDLLSQPTGQLALQCVLWLLCLFMLPAIGVGLWFPSRGTRVALAVAAIVVAAAAATGWPIQPLHAHVSGEMGGGCVSLVLGTGILLMGIGYLSGAFVQRRRVTAVFWVAAGLALVALNVVTWHCPHSGLMHVLPSHLGGAGILLLLAIVAGVLVHRRRRK